MLYYYCLWQPCPPLCIMKWRGASNFDGKNMWCAGRSDKVIQTNQLSNQQNRVILMSTVARLILPLLEWHLSILLTLTQCRLRNTLLRHVSTLTHTHHYSYPWTHTVPDTTNSSLLEGVNLELFFSSTYTRTCTLRASHDTLFSPLITSPSTTDNWRIPASCRQNRQTA